MFEYTIPKLRLNTGCFIWVYLHLYCIKCIDSSLNRTRNQYSEIKWLEWLYQIWILKKSFKIDLNTTL